MCIRDRVKTVDEFKGMNPKDVVDCIEGTPHISITEIKLLANRLNNCLSKIDSESAKLETLKEVCLSLSCLLYTSF